MKTKQMTFKPRPSTVVVTGTPGTGKTTISKSLARQLSADYLSLTKLVIDERLQAGFDQQRRSRIVDLERTRPRLRKLLREREMVTIIDSHVADAVPQECVMKVIVLRCHPRVLEARLHKKGWGAIKVRENVLAEILDSCYTIAVEYYGPKKTTQVDTSRTGIASTVNRCRALLKKQLPKPRVDWIAVLDREHLSARYMP